MENPISTIGSRDDYAVKYMEDELSGSDLVEIYNIKAENCSYEQFFPNDEATICDIISTDGRTPSEIWDDMGGSDYDRNADYVKFSDSTGCLECFYEDDIIDEVYPSELIEAFYESRFCSWRDDGFIDYIKSIFEDNCAPEGFMTWFSDNYDSSSEWDDVDSLWEEYEEWLEENKEEE